MKSETQTFTETDRKNRTNTRQLGNFAGHPKKLNESEQPDRSIRSDLRRAGTACVGCARDDGAARPSWPLPQNDHAISKGPVVTKSNRFIAIACVWCFCIAAVDVSAQQRSPNEKKPASFSQELLKAAFSEQAKLCGAAESEMARRGLIPAGSQPESHGCPSPNQSSGQATIAQLVSNEIVSPSDSVAMHFTDSDQQQIPDRPAAVSIAVNQAHADCFDGDPFPSARKCQACHPGHYREWSVSPHAYAQLSPVFNAMSSKLIKLNNGTLGDFCIRCHTPVGMALEEPVVMSNMDRHPAAREGVTCVVCHRINQNWGKGSGRQALVAGGLNAPIYGPTGNQVLEDAFANAEKFGALKTTNDPDHKARVIHQEVVPFFALTTSSFCGACHDVFAPNGFRLEDAFSEFKTSPAAREKHQGCQDCHMGLSPGQASGYAFEPAAKVGNVWTKPRKRTNHMIAGPDYSIIHPALFPHNPKAIREEHAAYADDPSLGLATMREWLEFDHHAGWGTPAFEDDVADDHPFPIAWEDQAKRFRARDILNDQFELLNEAKSQRHQVLSAAYKLGKIQVDRCDKRGLRFSVNVWNGTDGHGVPTGFDAERLVVLRVSVWDRNGRLVFVSGDLDPNGDVRDSHSFYVHNGELPIDRQLFSLQTRFLTRNVRGGEREQILNVPYSLDPLPYLRPATRPFTVLGRPLGARKHKQNLEVGGQRKAEYHIQPQQLTGCGPYRAQVELVAGMVPVNLVKEISDVGFDYGMSAREVAEAVVGGHMVVDSRTATFNVDK